MHKSFRAGSCPPGDGTGRRVTLAADQANGLIDLVLASSHGGCHKVHVHEDGVKKAEPVA